MCWCARCSEGRESCYGMQSEERCRRVCACAGASINSRLVIEWVLASGLASTVSSDFVAQAVEPAEPRVISAFPDGGRIQDGPRTSRKEKAEMNLGSAGLTACATTKPTACTYRMSFASLRLLRHLHQQLAFVGAVEQLVQRH